MAAAATAASAIDFKSQATFPIRLGTSVLKPSTPARFTSVKFNHKPKFKGSGNVKAVIKEGDGVGESKLLLEDDGSEYKFAGWHVQDEESYVLVVRGQGKEREMVLERMGSSHGFNLISTPSQSDVKVLADKYPHLPQDDGEEGDLFGDDEEDMPPDESNPFDYRHFLKAELEKQETAKEAAETARSSAGTPLVRSQAVAKSTPISRPAKVVKKAETKVQPAKKRKTTAGDKPNPKRVKAGEEPPVAAEPAKPKRPEIPKINLDRKASLRRPSMDDSGELILENETPISEKPPKHSAMALALSGQLGGGPISLRSAASSPGSHIASPAPPRPEGMDEEYVFEFDDSPEPSRPEDHVAPEDDGDADADEDEDDADVDDLELPSPAQVQRSNTNPLSANAGGDDDDDLDKQLALAMMEEDDGGNQESEESEEE